MATPTYARINTRFLLVTLLTSVLTAMILQKFNPVLILILLLLPWFIILFYYSPLFLVAIWHVLLFLKLIFPDMGFLMGPILFLPMDPAYFLGIIYVAIMTISRPKFLLNTIRENPFLILFLVIVILYTIIYTPTYGKQAIGEARKFYFFFLFPIMATSFLKEIKNLRVLLRVILVLTLGLLIYSLYRLIIIGSQGHEIASAESVLILLFTVSSIIVFQVNNEAIVNRLIDTSLLGLSLLIIILTQHRSVIMAAVFSIFLLFWLYRNRAATFLKLIFALTVFFIIIVAAFNSVPRFENMTMRYIKGLIDPHSDSTASWRMHGWREQLGKLSGLDVLLGEGLGNYFTWSYKGHEVNVEPHNGYVHTILKFGLLGLTVYVLLAFVFFWKLILVRRKLPLGTVRACVEMSILNFGAAHAYMMGYGFCPIMLVFYAIGMSAARLGRVSKVEVPQRGSNTTASVSDIDLDLNRFTTLAHRC